MGHRPNAILAYGYNLAGGDVDWAFTVDTPPDVSGVDWHSEHGDGDVGEQVDAVLGAHPGITFEHHGNLDEPSFLLAAHVQHADWDGPTALDLAELERLRSEQGWAAHLQAALDSLGITPDQDGPQWLLLAYGTGS